MNNRCGIPHIAYQQFSCPVSSISISVTWNNHITWIREHGTIIHVISTVIHMTSINKSCMHVKWWYAKNPCNDDNGIGYNSMPWSGAHEYEHETCHSICTTCTSNTNGQCLLSCTVHSRISVRTIIWHAVLILVLVEYKCVAILHVTVHVIMVIRVSYNIMSCEL